VVLRAASAGQTAALRRLVAQAAGTSGGNGALRLGRAAEGPPLLRVALLRVGTAWNVSSRPAALLLIGVSRKTVPALPEGLRALYGLPSAEAAVTDAITQGQGVKDAAAAQGVAPSTVRWHLQRVLRKRGRPGQPSLAALSSACLASPGPPQLGQAASARMGLAGSAAQGMLHHRHGLGAEREKASPLNAWQLMRDV